MSESFSQDNHVKTIRELLGMEEAGFLDVREEEAAPLPIVEEAKHEAKASLTLKKQRRIFSFLRSAKFRYVLVFLGAFVFFYLVLNFRAISQQVARLVSPLPKNEQAVLGDILPEYNQWIKKYYTYVSNQEVLAANHDADTDGLTNLDEFYIQTNPLKRDTDNDGFDDGGEVLNGYNPSYEGRLRDWQLETIAKHLDLGAINSRKQYRGIQKVGGRIISLPVDSFQVDPSIHGLVEIPKLGSRVPVTWSRDFQNMQEDLKYGAAHHPATKYPGEQGLASIHAHSSGYPWDGNYKTAFTKVNFLEPGDEVFVTVYGTNKESRRYRYLVRSKGVYAKDDSQQFVDLGGYYLNLSTSWPVGTARERYVVTTELVGL